MLRLGRGVPDESAAVDQSTFRSDPAPLTPTFPIGFGSIIQYINVDA